MVVASLASLQDMRGLAPFIACAGLLVLWIAVIAPLILRAVGVPIGLWRVDRRNETLTWHQYIWGVGVFGWGLGMFLFTNLLDYLQWRFSGGLSRHTPTFIAFSFLTWLAGGLLFGLMSSSGRLRR